MFFNFVDELRAAGIPASFKEHLVLLEALDKEVIEQTPEAFYYLSRATFVKDEGLLDRFDQVFNKVFKGILSDYGQKPVEIPEDWLKAIAEKFLTPEEMGTRNIKIALRRLRRFAREGNAEELDLDATIDGTARQGWLDIHMRPERHNAVKVLLFFDVGGSMDPWVKLCEELFSAASSEFKNMEFFYFHNCLYESVWKDNRRRWSERTPTWDLLHKFGHDYKVIFVGDAAMSPYEISHPGGSVEHFNEESGAVWIDRVAHIYPATVWLNPVPEKQWGYSQSTKMIRDMVGGSMYPLTLDGLDDAMRELTRKKH
ncbi:MAG: VWA domain-containing protein [Novosphingobium sp.]|nr:VWA domain-containing protein [Novosphingobium sp.]